MSAIGAALCLQGLSGCFIMPVRDASSKAEYREVIGARFRTTRDLLAIGVTRDQNYEQRTDYISLWAPPGFSGPEVVWTDTLPAGVILEITGVGETAPFRRVHYVAKVVPGTGRRFFAPFWIDKKGSVKDINYGIDTALYQKVDAPDSSASRH